MCTEVLAHMRTRSRAAQVILGLAVAVHGGPFSSGFRRRATDTKAQQRVFTSGPYKERPGAGSSRALSHSAHLRNSRGQAAKLIHFVC